MRVLIAGALAVLAVLLGPASVLAHGGDGGAPLVHVPLDHVAPGRPFPVLLASFEPSTEVVLTLTVNGAPVEIGRLTTDDDGGAEGTFGQPVGTPSGYLLLTAISSAGSTATTYINLAGAGQPEAAGAVPLDRALLALLVIGLAVLVVGLIVVSGMRRRRRARS